MYEIINLLYDMAACDGNDQAHWLFDAERAREYRFCIQTESALWEEPNARLSAEERALLRKYADCADDVSGGNQLIFFARGLALGLKLAVLGTL